ncbi:MULTISPECIES: TIGR02301 family protein [unclassified Roseitalea]|uniref:TIGR02301 family protein n=1 Tax=unclassified Roseitalea TaxID=2639107 RepID=UPI00273FDFC2|nr:MULTISPECIES: TIGR02301 family protein [unclassified Roseitalea]
MAAALWLAVASASAQPVTAPYDEHLNRLAERLGAIHYLRNLCTEPTNEWRDQMSALLSAEQPQPARRARLIASFNKGYRSFDSVYIVCTDQARSAADRYVEEARQLASELINTFGTQ